MVYRDAQGAERKTTVKGGFRMCSKTGGVPFHGTKEQEEALLQVIAELKDDKGA